MLGRYVAGTLLILGVAMLLSPPPDKPERPEPVRVEAVVPEPAAPAPEVVVVEPAVTVPPSAVPDEDDPMKGGIAAAVEQALSLDSAETSSVTEGVAPDEGGDDAAQVDGVSLESLAVAGTIDAMMENLRASGGLDEPAAAPTLSRETLFVTGDRVNVRAGPSTAYEVIGTVIRGEPVELMSMEDGSWARIRFGNEQVTGYMSRNFLSDSPTDG